MLPNLFVVSAFRPAAAATDGVVGEISILLLARHDIIAKYRNEDDPAARCAPKSTKEEVVKYLSYVPEYLLF
jgi:hypothetical protein